MPPSTLLQKNARSLPSKLPELRYYIANELAPTLLISENRLCPCVSRLAMSSLMKVLRVPPSTTPRM